MNIGQQILFSISALGAFNGLVLGLYLFFISKRGKSLPAFFLGLLLLALSIRVVKSVFLYFNPQLPKIYLQIGLSACFFIGPSLYYFLRSTQLKEAVVPVAWKWSWGILVAILVLGDLIIPYQTFPGLWKHAIAYIIYGQWLGYLIASGFLLKGSLANAAGLKTAEKLPLWVFLGNCIIFLAYLLAALQVVRGIYISGALSFSLILYVTVFFYLYNARIRTGETAAPRKKIAENDAQAWAEKLEKAIRDNELYKDPNLKLSDLARRINIPPHQLSQLLNDNLGKSFSTYINEYRINEACKLIAGNNRLTLEAIGYEVGYNSKSTFYTAFKKVKDTTPALFKESIK